jgi:beta-phosphoglucomutase family hydrolase
MLKGAIFDMDGVLVDNMKIHMKAFAEFVSRYGLDFDLEYIMSLNGMGGREFMEAALPGEIIERVGVDELIAEKETVYRRIYAPLLAPARGLVAFLDDLKAHGVRIAVGTSAITANLDFVPDGLGIRRRFDVLVTADMVERTKPHPDIYLRALAELGLPGDECLVFEDALAGIEAASAAGIRSVGLSTSLPASVLAATPGVVLAAPDFTEMSHAQLDALLSVES